MTFDPFQRRVKDEMSRDVVAIESTAPLLIALKRMEDEGVTVLPVVDDDRCVGVISTTDVIHTAQTTANQLHDLVDLDEVARKQRVTTLVDNGMGQLCVRDVMQYKLKAVNQEMTIADAGRKMLLARFHHLPVIDDEQRLVGIISTLDLVAAFVKGASQRHRHARADEKSNDADLQ